jgi:hypothetical protein
MYFLFFISSIFFSSHLVHTQIFAPFKSTDATKKEMQEDFTRRVALSHNALPSVCFFTIFHAQSWCIGFPENTQPSFARFFFSLSPFLVNLLRFPHTLSPIFFSFSQSLNSLNISNDGSLVVGCFEDSSLRVWDLKSTNKPPTALPPPATAQPQPTPPEAAQTPAPIAPFVSPWNETPPPERGIPLGDHTVLFGHSGPLYASSFSPDNQLLITCSEDKTGKEMMNGQTFLWVCLFVFFLIILSSLPFCFSLQFDCGTWTAKPDLTLPVIVDTTIQFGM